MPGEQMAIRIHSNQVGGAISIVEARVPSLMGPPKHFHNEREETFEILEGTIITNTSLTGQSTEEDARLTISPNLLEV